MFQTNDRNNKFVIYKKVKKVKIIYFSTS